MENFLVSNGAWTSWWEMRETKLFYSAHFGSLFHFRFPEIWRVFFFRGTHYFIQRNLITKVPFWQSRCAPWALLKSISCTKPIRARTVILTLLDLSTCCQAPCRVVFSKPRKFNNVLVNFVRLDFSFHYGNWIIKFEMFLILYVHDHVASRIDFSFTHLN